MPFADGSASLMMTDGMPFTAIYGMIEPPIRQGLDLWIARTAAWVRPALQWGLAAYFAIRMLWRALTHSGAPFGEMEGLLLKGAVALFLAANAAAYSAYVRDLLLYGLPGEISALVQGATGHQPVTAEMFDRVWNRAFNSGIAIFKTIGWSNFGLALLVVAFLLIALLSITNCFLIWLKAFLFLALLIGLGPIFVGLFLFPGLRNLSRGWFSSVLANILLQVFVVALLSVLIGAEATLLRELSTTDPDDAIRQIHVMTCGLAIFVCCWWVALQLPGLASAICGGVAAEASSLSGVLDSFLNPPPTSAAPRRDRDPTEPAKSSAGGSASRLPPIRPPGRSLG